MRHLMLSLLPLLLAASALSATEGTPSAPPVPAVVPAAEPAPPAGAAMHLSEVRLEERTASSEAVAAQLGPRGGFWWIVGVVVVAGVLLAVLL